MSELKFILHIDDDVDDLLIFKEAIALSPVPVKLQQEQEARSALRCLRSINNMDRLPHLIIADLNMPDLSGKEFITIVKNDPLLKDIPIVAFTTSSLQYDKDFCIRNGVDFRTKPVLFSELSKIVNDMLLLCKTENHNLS